MSNILITNSERIMVTNDNPKKPFNNKGGYGHKQPNDRKQSQSPSNLSNSKFNNKNKGNSSGGRKPVKCAICDGEHYANNCPELEGVLEVYKNKKDIQTENANITFNHMSYVTTSEAVLSTQSYELTDNIVLLDNQCTYPIFKNSLLLGELTDLTPERRYGGINAGNSDLIAVQQGQFLTFGSIPYSPDATANVLSKAHLRDMGLRMGYDYGRDEEYVIDKNNKKHTFKRYGNFYGMDCKNIMVQKAFVSTVLDNEQRYNKRQVEYAKRAREFERRMGYQPIESLSSIIGSGAIIECPVTAHDLQRAKEIYGPPIATVKGKTRTQQAQLAHVEPIPRVIYRRMSMEVDIMFVNKLPFLITVTAPIGMTMTTYLGGTGGRSTTSVYKALKNHLQTYQREHFDVLELHCDGEGAIKALVPTLNQWGIRLEPHAPGSHCQIVERKIQTLKGGIRSCTHALPWRASLTILVWCVYFCANRINLVPNKTGYTNLCPQEALTGKKINYKIDVRVGFGDYVQMKTPNIESNSNISRTEGGIALLPVGNTQGSVKFYTMLTGRIVMRDQFTVLPTPGEVIDFMNQLADKDKIKVNGDIEVKNGRNAPVIDMEQMISPAINDISSGINHTIEIQQSEKNVNENIEFIPDVSRADATDDISEHDMDDNMHSDQYEDTTIEIINEDTQNSGVQDTISENNSASDAGDHPSVEALDTPNSSDSDEKVQQSETTTNTSQEPTQRGIPSATTEDNNTAAQQNIQPTQRYNLRSRNKVNYDELNKHGHVFQTYLKQAIKTSPTSTLTATVNELKQLLDKHTWEPQDPSIMNGSRKVIRSMVFLKEKYRPDGSFDKLKARLVADGSGQVRSLYDEAEISSPTASLSSVLMVATIAAKERRHVITADISGAYLNANMGTNDVFMLLDPISTAIMTKLDNKYEKYLTRNGSVVVKLKKALYGCIESAKLWYNTLCNDLNKFGFLPNVLDSCVFNKTVNGAQVTLLLYVDDLFITSKSEELTKETINYITKLYGKLTSTYGMKHSYLGMTFDFSVPDLVKVNMNGYINDIINDYNIIGMVKTPGAETLFEVRAEIPSLSLCERESFHSAVARLLYLAKRVRPDILTVVAYLTTRVQQPNLDDSAKLGRLLKYLNGTKDLGLILGDSQNDNTLKLTAHIDASYGVHNDAKSQSGLVIKLGNGTVFVRSSKQKLVSKSSTEAELIALSDNGSQVIWTREFLKAQGYEMEPTTIFQDNMSTIAMMQRGRSNSERTRHVNIRFFWLKDRQDSGEIKIEYLPTKEMIADIMTKPLQGDAFTYMRGLLLNSGS
jgi:ribosomal protein L24E